MAFLVLDKVSKYYGTFGAVVDFSLSVERGEFVCLLGPSGCGKTTTLQALAGFAPITSGRIHLDGQDITAWPANRRGLGIVFQSYALFPHMTVAENVRFGLEMRRVARASCDAQVARILELVQLDALAARYPRELSGGQRQRVALARALVIEPPVLLLDEPLSNLDAQLREAMLFELRRIQRKLGTTTIMVTHDQAEALSIADRVVVMEGGRATQIDTPERLYEHPANRFISGFVGKTNWIKARVGEAGRAVLANGTEIALPELAAHYAGFGLADPTTDRLVPALAFARLLTFTGKHARLWAADSRGGAVVPIDPASNRAGARVALS